MAPDYAQQDLFEAIAGQKYPAWGVYVQVMTEAQAANFHVNPFDLTKVWPHAMHPLLEVGEIVLHKNPENYFAEVEQAAFSPSNIVPGMGFSPDKVLQARLFSYPDAQRYRVGSNYQQLPVNKPRCPFHNHQRDGAMRFDDNGGAAPNYEPNAKGDVSEDKKHRQPAISLEGNIDRHDHRIKNDDYTQAGNLFRLMDTPAKKRLIENIVESMKNAPPAIQAVQIAHFSKADPDYGEGVAAGLEMRIEEISANQCLTVVE